MPGHHKALAVQRPVRPKGNHRGRCVCKGHLPPPVAPRKFQATMNFETAATEGEMGILPGHAALLAELRPGPASLETGSKVEHFVLGEGFVEVSDDTVTALVLSAEAASEIDVERANTRRAELEKELHRTSITEEEARRAEASLEKQQARIQVGKLSH